MVNVANNFTEREARETLSYTAEGVAEIVLSQVASIVQADETKLRVFMTHVLHTVHELITAGDHASWATSMVKTLAAKLCVVGGQKRDDLFQAVSEATSTYNQNQEWSSDKFFDWSGALEYSVKQYVEKPLDPSELAKTLSGILKNSKS